MSGNRPDPLVERTRGIANVSGTPYDVTWITQITDNLYQGGCRTGLWLPSNIVHLISLYPWEQYRTNGDQLQSALSVKMHDAEDQSFDQVDAIAAWVNVCRKDGPTLVHCQMGLNRSGLVAARALVLSGEALAEDAIALLRERRSPAVLCNASFVDWLTNQ